MADHYEVLGVDRNASADDIKKAYRRLARELHPDVNPSPDASDQFKLVTHAYDVLSDPDQRQQYDLGGAGQYSAGNFGGFGDIFETFFGAATGAQQRVPRSCAERGQDALLRVELETGRCDGLGVGCLGGAARRTRVQHRALQDRFTQLGEAKTCRARDLRQ